MRPRNRAQGPSRYNGSFNLGPHMHAPSTVSTPTHHLTAPYGRAPDGPRAKLDTYDGKDDWDSFIIPFERRDVIYRWSAVERVDKLHECLRGAAVRYLCSLPEHIREDYFLLEEQLAFRFGQKEPPTTARRRLGELRQSKETVSEFAEEVHRLVVLAYPGVDIELREQLAADICLKGPIQFQSRHSLMGTQRYKTLTVSFRMSTKFEGCRHQMPLTFQSTSDNCLLLQVKHSRNISKRC